ncbi:hypothetical protein VTO73DRAFT_1866 [Trametes versicolor]
MAPSASLRPVLLPRPSPPKRPAEHNVSTGCSFCRRLYVCPLYPIFPFPPSRSRSCLVVPRCAFSAPSPSCDPATYGAPCAYALVLVPLTRPPARLLQSVRRMYRLLARFFLAVAAEQRRRR